jgi:hypothetical protein
MTDIPAPEDIDPFRNDCPARTCPYTFRAIPAIIHVWHGFLPLSVHFGYYTGESKPVSIPG